jgi:hypothetical protein
MGTRNMIDTNDGLHDSESSENKNDIERIHHQLLEYLLRNRTNDDTSSAVFPSSSKIQYNHEQVSHEDYIPMYTYLRSNYILNLRQQLKQMNYPNATAVSHVENDNSNSGSDGPLESKNLQQQLDAIVLQCQSIYHLEYIHQQVLMQHPIAAASSTTSSTPRSTLIDPVLQEFCRPIVERIHLRHSTRARRTGE